MGVPRSPHLFYFSFLSSSFFLVLTSTNTFVMPGVPEVLFSDCFPFPTAVFLVATPRFFHHFYKIPSSLEVGSFVLEDNVVQQLSRDSMAHLMSLLPIISSWSSTICSIQFFVFYAILESVVDVFLLSKRYCHTRHYGLDESLSSCATRKSLPISCYRPLRK